MRNQRIVKAYNSINPTADAKERMLRSIQAESTSMPRMRREVSTATPKKDSRKGLVGAIAACFAMVLLGGVVLARIAAEPEVPADTQPRETTSAASPYDALLQTYTRALQEGWSDEECLSHNISMQFASADYAEKNAGYAFVDLDGNGTEELIVGHGMPHYVYVWDLYALDNNGKPVQLHTDTKDHTNCHLYENGIIGLEYSGKTEGAYSYFRVNGSTLTSTDVLTYRDDIWYNEVAKQQISPEEAHEILDKYDMIDVELTYLADVPDYLREGNAALEEYLITLEKYRTAVTEKWNQSQCMDADISILIANFVETPGALGYTLIDLDGDGSEELIITDGNVLLGVYQKNTFGIQQVLTGWERNVYYLCEGNKILNRGSNGAASTVYNLCYISSGGLVQIGSVVFDALTNPDQPWSYQKYGNDPFATITEEEANEIIDSYVTVPIDFTPILE